MDLLSMEVREKLDRLILPEEAEDPIVLRFDPSLDPILRIALFVQPGPEDSVEDAEKKTGDPEVLKRLRFLAEQRIKLDLETLEGVAAAQVRGGLEEEIQIDVDQERLAALGIPLSRVREVVGASNVNAPGGPLRGESSQYLIRIINEFRKLDDIRALTVFHNSGASVKLDDIAEVRWGAREREEITRVGKHEAVEIAIYKQADANTVMVAREVRAKLDEWDRKLQGGYALTTLFDQSGFIENSVNEVRDAAIIGGILAIIILFAFLRDARSTLIVATSIPLSVLATFLCMYRLDISLNIMSLGGLTLGIGMLVDSSVVVLEAIFRARQRKLGRTQAAVEGATEVGPAVLASTLTTVAVFLPIVFVEGIAGQLFHDQAMTVTLSLLASLLVALTVIPMLSAAGGRSSDTSDENAAEREAAPPPPSELPDAMTLGTLSRAYDRLLRSALRRRSMTLGLAIVLFSGSVWSLRWIGQELIPALSQGEFLFEVNLPEGATLQATDQRIGEMEDAAASLGTVEKTYSSIGTRLVTGGMSLNTKAENIGQINVVMTDRGDDELEGEAIEFLRQKFDTIPDLEVKFHRPSYFSLKTPIEVVIFGEELSDLESYSLEIVEKLETIPGLVDVRSSLEAGHPELQIVFNRDILAARGLRQDTLTEALQGRVAGVVPTRFQEPDRQIDVRIRNHESTRSSSNDIRNLVVPSVTAVPLRLGEVADIVESRGPAEIHRVEQQRAAVITANLKGRSLGGAITDVEHLIAESPPKRGMSTELGGQNREMKVSFDSLKFVLALAIFMVYMVMASVFESFVHPFVVLFTIPLSLVGVVAGLLATGTTITVVVLIGGVMLVGIVVNNAIVLIDAVNRYRRRGMDKLEAVVRAGHVRLRPILMTTLTTVLGLLPMAISWGEGAELRAPLAITVASGLFLSTLLTLVVIPAVYMVVPSKLSAKEIDETSAEEPTP